MCQLSELRILSLNVPRGVGLGLREHGGGGPPAVIRNRQAWHPVEKEGKGIAV